MRSRVFFVLAWLGAGCDDTGIDLERMRDQPKLLPYSSSRFFEDGVGMRRPPEGTVHRDALLGPEPVRAGRSNGAYVTDIPIAVDRALLRRGENRFFVFCAACHGPLGDGKSPVAENMFLRPPPSLHEQRLRDYPPGRLYAVIHEGFGLMPSYAAELPVNDRWAVVAYVRALQLSQFVRIAELTDPEDKEWLK